MPKRGRVYEKHDNVVGAMAKRVLKPGWTAKVDPNVKLGIEKTRAVAEEHPQARSHVFNEEVDQFKEAKRVLSAPTKVQSKDAKPKPSLKHKFLGAAYGKQDKDDDDDDIRAAIATAKSTGSKKSATGSSSGNHAYDATKIDPQAQLILNSIKPVHVLLDALQEEKDDPKDHVFPLKKLKCMDYLWTCQGKRRTGKTTLWKNVFPRYAHAYPYVYFFAQTRFAGQFGSYAPEQAIHKGFNEAVLWKLLEIQEIKIRQNLRLYDYWSQYEDPELLVNIPNPYVYFMWDDTIGGKLVHDSDTLNETAYFGRHYRTSGWINTQHGHAIHPGFRANTDIASMYLSLII